MTRNAFRPGFEALETRCSPAMLNSAALTMPNRWVDPDPLPAITRPVANPWTDPEPLPMFGISIAL